MRTVSLSSTAKTPSRTTIGRSSQTQVQSTAAQRMIDGLYQVTTRYLCAAFVVEGGKVTACAPILRKNIAYWKTVARRIRPPSEFRHRSSDQGSGAET